MMWDPLYLLFAVPALLLAMIAQFRVQSAYQRYLKVPNRRGITGAQAAPLIMRTAGVNVALEGIAGTLSDHYDPRKKVLRLSQGVANYPTVASVAIVAHEIGHAQQDAEAYQMLRVRTGLVPIVNLTSWLGPLLFMLGWFLQAEIFLTLGIWTFAGAVLFALVTLPVELNASHRAMQFLEQSGVLSSDEELRGAKTVLNAAALTYIAALAQALSTFSYYLFRFGGRRRS